MNWLQTEVVVTVHSAGNASMRLKFKVCAQAKIDRGECVASASSHSATLVTLELRQHFLCAK